MQTSPHIKIEVIWKTPTRGLTSKFPALGVTEGEKFQMLPRRARCPACVCKEQASGRDATYMQTSPHPQKFVVTWKTPNRCCIVSVVTHVRTGPTLDYSQKNREGISALKMRSPYDLKMHFNIMRCANAFQHNVVCKCISKVQGALLIVLATPRVS